LFACICWQPATAHSVGIGIQHTTLIVQVRSDLTYPGGFDRVVISSTDGNLHDIFTWEETWTPEVGQDVATGARVLEQGGFHNGELRFRVSMMKGSDMLVSRPVRVTIEEGNVRVVTVLLSKETPILTWPSPPSSIVYGRPLGAPQLNASASTTYQPNHPGSYAYSPPAGTVLPVGNHTLSVTFTPSNPAAFNSATKSVSLTVTKAPLIIDPDDKVRPPGIANPPLTARYLGLVNGDTAGNLDVPASLSTPAIAASPPSGYVITASGAVDVNYTIIFFSGTLTITEKEIPSLIWSAPAPLTYGASLGPGQLSVQPTGGVLGTFGYSPPAGTLLNAGIHPIRATFTPANATRYETVSLTIDLTVDQAPLTIIADNRTRTVGEANPVLTATYVGLVNGDTIASLSSPPALSTSARVSSPAGAYPILLFGAFDPNYSITQVDGTLTVLEPAGPPVLRIRGSKEGVEVSWNHVPEFVLFSSFDLLDWDLIDDITVQGDNATYWIPAAQLDLLPSAQAFRLQRVQQ